MSKPIKPVEAEMEVMKAITVLLDPLDEDARRRVLYVACVVQGLSRPPTTADPKGRRASDKLPKRNPFKVGDRVQLRSGPDRDFLVAAWGSDKATVENVSGVFVSTAIEGNVKVGRVTNHFEMWALASTPTPPAPLQGQPDTTEQKAG